MLRRDFVKAGVGLGAVSSLVRPRMCVQDRLWQRLFEEIGFEPSPQAVSNE